MTIYVPPYNAFQRRAVVRLNRRERCKRFCNDVRVNVNVIINVVGLFFVCCWYLVTGK